MSSLTQSIFTPQLRVFRRLDVGKLSPDFIETIGAAEGNYELVDVDRARDQMWTEEIMKTTIGAALVNADGDILKEFPGKDGFLAAERAKSSARVVIDYEMPGLDDSSDDAIPEGFEGLEPA